MRWASPLLWVAVAAAGAAAILRVPLAPLPPCDNVTDGPARLYASGFVAEWTLAAPATDTYKVAVRARGGSGAANARFSLADETGHSLLDISVDVSGPTFQTTLVSQPVALSNAHSYRLSLRETTAPFAADFIELQPTTGAPLRLEVETAKLSGGGLVAVSPDASGGAWAGSVPRTESEHLEQTFHGSAAVMNGVSLNVGFPTDLRSEVAISLDDVSTGRRLMELRRPAGLLPWKGQLVRLRFPPAPALGHDFRIAIDRVSRAFTALPLGGVGAFPEGQLVANGIHLASDLLFVPRYELVWRRMAYAGAALALVLIAAGWLLKNGGPGLAPVVMLLLSLVSVAYWQRDYQFTGASHWIADGYDEYADHIQSVLRGSPGAVERLRAYSSGYPHAHSPLVPLLVAVCSFIASTVRSYLLLSYLAALVTAAVLLRLLMEIRGASRTVTWALWGIGVTHFLFVRIIARTSTDGFGYMFTVVALLLALRLARSETWRTRDLAVLVLVLTLGLFARPTVVPLPPALSFGLLLASWTQGRLNRPRMVGAGLLTLAPLAAFFGGIWLLGLWRTFALAKSEMAFFADARTPVRLLICVGVLVQLLAVPLLLGARKFRDPEVIVGLSWAGASIAFVILTGTFWNRHFAHALPGLLMAAVPGLTLAFDRYPALSRAAVLACAAANLGLISVTLARDVGFGAAYLFQ